MIVWMASGQIFLAKSSEACQRDDVPRGRRSFQLLDTGHARAGLVL